MPSVTIRKMQILARFAGGVITPAGGDLDVPGITPSSRGNAPLQHQRHLHPGVLCCGIAARPGVEKPGRGIATAQQAAPAWRPSERLFHHGILVPAYDLCSRAGKMPHDRGRGVRASCPRSAAVLSQTASARSAPAIRRSARAAHSLEVRQAGRCISDSTTHASRRQIEGLRQHAGRRSPSAGHRGAYGEWWFIRRLSYVMAWRNLSSANLNPGLDPFQGAGRFGGDLAMG